MIQRRAMAGIALAAASTLAGCGFQAPAVTEHEHASVQAQDFQVGSVRVRDTFVTSPPTATTPAVPYLVFTLVNDSTAAETLTGITSPLGTVTLTGPGVLGGSLQVPPNGVPLSIDQPALSPGGPTATFTAGQNPALGTYVPVQFTFSGGGASPVEQVPVVPATETTAVASPVPQGTAVVPTQPGESASD